MKSIVTGHFNFQLNHLVIDLRCIVCLIDTLAHKLILIFFQFSNAKGNFNASKFCRKNTFHVVKFCVVKFTIVYYRKFSLGMAKMCYLLLEVAYRFSPTDVKSGVSEFRLSL